MAEELLEQIEKKANQSGWYKRKFFRQVACTGCGNWINLGFVLSPGMNYAICVECANTEFLGAKSETEIRKNSDSEYSKFYR